jgi:hypothetical protein
MYVHGVINAHNFTITPYSKIIIHYHISTPITTLALQINRNEIARK